ncbi:unnamed protein product [Cylicostephanus goldi]|uniref:Neurotransmitter-gated ion-channel ligand-binding domain-containing protein n=1 Tax=Cylicostephanus goldi TaxID=71465 RepID=A0A3P6QM51_CYLGO|nr:unnamed protein product [Cylicostephanus goldi]
MYLQAWNSTSDRFGTSELPEPSTCKHQIQPNYSPTLRTVIHPLFSYETHLKNGDAFDMRRVETSATGNVSAVLAFSLRSFCDDSDFENYPDDVYKCCFTLEPQANPVRFSQTTFFRGISTFQDIIEFDTSGLPIFTDPKYFRDYGWKVSGTVPQSLEDPAQVAQLGFCLNLQRSSSSVRIELTVPMMVCALLFLLTPFLGVIKIQVHEQTVLRVIVLMCLMVSL